MDHYLLSIRADGATDMHCYLMCNDRRSIEGAASKMMEIVEEATGGPMRLPIFLSTGPLTKSGISKVRKVLAGRSPEAGKMLKKVKDYHISIWVMARQDPDSLGLMGLH